MFQKDTEMQRKTSSELQNPSLLLIWTLSLVIKNIYLICNLKAWDFIF